MPAALATHPALDRVPVIDFGPFGTGTDDGSRRVAREIAATCAQTGFFYLAHHGVPAAKIAATFAAARLFFALPEPTRRDPALLVTPHETRGYMPLGARHYPGTGAPDLMEAFKLQAELPPDDPDLVAGNRGQQRNKWPAGQAAFRATLLDYFDEMTRCRASSCARSRSRSSSRRIIFCRSSASRRPSCRCSTTRLSRRPPRPTPTASGRMPMRPPSPSCARTRSAVCKSRQPDGGWIAVPPIADTYVINIGDMMARWTNDRFASTKHRVLNRTGQERYSLPFFGIPDFDAVVACLPTCEGPGNPAKYPPIHVGEFIRRKNASDWSGDKT